MNILQLVKDTLEKIPRLIQDQLNLKTGVSFIHYPNAQSLIIVEQVIDESDPLIDASTRSGMIFQDKSVVFSAFHRWRIICVSTRSNQVITYLTSNVGSPYDNIGNSRAARIIDNCNVRLKIMEDFFENGLKHSMNTYIDVVGLIHRYRMLVNYDFSSEPNIFPLEIL